MIGGFQPHKIIDGKRKPEGETIQDYYPPIISKSLFYQVQEQMSNNAKLFNKDGGKTGKANNLFVYIAVCGECGGALHYIDKGKGQKGGQYLHCGNSRRKIEVTKILEAVNIKKDKKGNISLGTKVAIDSRKKSGLPYSLDIEKTFVCHAKPIPYYEFEELFFDNFEKLDASMILPNNSEINQLIKDLGNEIRAQKHEEKLLEFRFKNTIESISETEDKDLRKSFIKEAESLKYSKEKVRISYEKVENELRQLKSKSEQIQNSIDTTKEVYSILNSIKDESEKISLRLKLRTEIKRIVRQIKIYPLKESYQKHKELKEDSCIIETMHSKSIDRVSIIYNDCKDKTILLQKSYIDLSQPF